MSDPNQPSTPAGWYPDGQGGQRWWDGTQWTEHTQPAQGAAPAAPAAPAEPTPPADPMQTVVAPRTPAQGFPAQAGPGQPPSGPTPAQPGYQQPGQPGVPPWQGQTPASGGGGGGKGKLIAIIAGAAALVVIAAIVLVVVVFGGGGPGDVAKDYLEAESEADLEQVCELSSKESRKQLQEFYEVDDCAGVADKVKDEEDFDQGVKLLDDVEFEIEIGEVDEKDDSATVKYSEDIEYTGDDEEGFTAVFGEETKFTTKGTITMVKEDGDWKVDSDETEE